MIHCGDSLAVLKTLPDESVQVCVTSPPYFALRDYGHEGQIGLEASPAEYLAKLVAIFEEVRRVLKPQGTLWLNIGDSYAGSGRGAWDISDEEKTARGVKETYRPNVRSGGTGIGDSAKVAAVQRGLGEDRNGLKPKDLMGIPWRLAFALQSTGWYLRCDVIWHKPNPMPESVEDRPTKAHEYLFLLSKSQTYYYDHNAIKEPSVYAGPNSPQKSKYEQGFARRTAEQEKARQDKQRGHGRRHTGFNDRWDSMSREEQTSLMRNKRSVWTIATKPFPEAHFATFPEDLVHPCIAAGSKPGDVILDPFAGSGTVGVVARKMGREFIGIELNPAYVEMAERRIDNVAPLFAQ